MRADRRRRLVALDAKMTFDDNGLFRHTDLRGLRDLDEEDPLEVEASKYGLNYIKLDGTVACMVNGAGLAMATMDSSNIPVAHRQISLTSAAALPPNRSRTHFASCLAMPASKLLHQHLRGILRCDVLATASSPPQRICK